MKNKVWWPKIGRHCWACPPMLQWRWHIVGVVLGCYGKSYLAEFCNLATTKATYRLTVRCFSCWIDAFWNTVVSTVDLPLCPTIFHWWCQVSIHSSTLLLIITCVMKIFCFLWLGWCFLDCNWSNMTENEAQWHFTFCNNWWFGLHAQTYGM